MSELDDMLHRAFANDAPETRFEFREEHWLQAKALLEADERRRKRLLVWWRVLGGALLLGLLVGGGWYLANPVESVVPTAPTLQQPVANTPTQTGPATAAPSGLVAGAGKQPAVENTQNQQITTQKFASPAAVVPPAGAADRTDLPAGPIAAPLQPKTALTVAGVAPLLTPLSTDSYSSSAPLADTPLQNNTVESGAAHQPTTVATATVDRAVPALAGLPVELPLELHPTFQQEATAKALGGTYFMGEPPTKMAEPPTKIHRQRGWSGGLVAGLASPTGLPGDQKIGGVLGTSVSYRVHPNWSLNADPLLRVRRAGQTETYTEFVDSLGSTLGNYNDGLNTPTSVVNTYDFGYNLAVTEAAPSTGIWLEMPVYAQWHFKKLQVSAGVLTSVALLTRKQEREYRSNSLNPSNQLFKSSSSWETASSPYFRSWSVGATAGIGWELRKGWTIEAKGSWLPQTYLSKPLNQALNDASQSTYNPYAGSSSTWIDLRVKWLFWR